MYAAGPVAERLVLPEYVGQQPRDREPHLRTLQARLMRTTRPRAGVECESRPVVPARCHHGQPLPRPGVHLAPPVGRLLTAQPERVDDIEHFARRTPTVSTESIVASGRGTGTPNWANDPRVSR